MRITFPTISTRKTTTTSIRLLIMVSATVSGIFAQLNHDHNNYHTIIVTITIAIHSSLYRFLSVTQNNMLLLTPQLNYISMKFLPLSLLTQRDEIREGMFCNETTVRDMGCKNNFCECPHIINVSCCFISLSSRSISCIKMKHFSQSFKQFTSFYIRNCYMYLF